MIRFVFYTAMMILVCMASYCYRIGGDSMERRPINDNLRLLDTCSDQTKTTLLRSGKLVYYPEKHVIISAREETDAVYFIVDGKVLVYYHSDQGQKRSIFILGDNEIANESIVEGKNSVYCETIEPSAFFAVQRKSLLSMMATDFELTLTLMRYQEHKTRRMSHQLKNTAFNISLEQRLAAKLWKLAKDFGEDGPDGIVINMRLSVAFLSELVGASREKTSKALKKLCQFGYLLIEGRKIILCNPEGLRDYYKTGLCKLK